jgi:hypothetical protein
MVRQARIAEKSPPTDQVERIDHAIDAVEPGRNQGDLQDAAVVESAARNRSW